MRNLASPQLLLFVLLGQLTSQTTLTPSWPTISSPIKLLGLFPRQDTQESKNDMWTTHGRSMFRAAILLSQRYNITFHGHFLTYEDIITDDNIMLTVDQTCKKVLTSNILGLVGPAYSSEARYLASLAYQLGIISVSYSATSPDLSTIDTGAFYRIVPSDENTALSLITFFQRYEWKSCLIIYQNDEYGYNGMKLLSEKFSGMNMKTLTTVKFDMKEQSFQVDFQKTLIDSFSRVVIVWANEKSTITILKKALEAGVIGPSFVWILTATVALDGFDQQQQQELIGILTVEPTKADLVDVPINTTLLNEAYEIWNSSDPETFPGNANVSSYALFTFDAAWSLILSLQQLCSRQPSCLKFLNASDCYHRQFVSWKEYYSIMKTMSFLGVSGEVKFSNGTTDRIGDVYYIMKNIQPINTAHNQIDYISVLKWSVSASNWTHYKNESGDILWPNLSNRVPVDHKLIQGQTLRIAIIDSPPFILLKNSTASYSGMTDNYKTITLTEFDGFFKDVLIYLTDQMGFIPVVLLAAPTTTYDQLVEGVADDLFDTVMTSLIITEARTRIVDFATALMPSSIRIIVRKPESLQLDYLFFLRPFPLSLWLIILFTIPYASVLFWYFERGPNPPPDNVANRNQILTIRSSFSYVICTLFGKGHPYDVKSDAGRVLTYGLNFLQIILLALYLARVLSSVIMQIAKSDISGTDDIKNGKVSPNRIGIVEGSYIKAYYLNFISPDHRSYYPLKTTNEIYTRLLSNDIDAALWTNVSTEYHVNNIYCNLMTVGVPFGFSLYQMPVKKEWLYTADLDSNILGLIDSGELDRISAKWFGQRQCAERDLPDTGTKKITTKTMTGLYIVFVTIGFTSIIIHCWTEMDNPIKTKISRLYQKCVEKMNHLLSCLRIPELLWPFLVFFFYLLSVLLCLFLFPE